MYPEAEKMTERLIFDTHAHYDDKKFSECSELFEKLPDYGVCNVVTCGCDRQSSLAALRLAERFDYIFAAVGIHPGNIPCDTTVQDIESLASHEKCVAIGEIGLDYYWDKDHHQEQQRIFEEQLILAKRLDLPVSVHDREAHSDTLEILRKHQPKGVVHCFSGSVEMAKEILKLGMYIGVGGVVTFKNAKKLPDVVAAIPDDRLLLETDCPYLAPEPFRGKLCHSGLISLTAKRIAEIRGTTAENVLRISKQNAKNLFGI